MYHLEPSLAKCFVRLKIASVANLMNVINRCFCFKFLFSVFIMYKLGSQQVFKHVMVENIFTTLFQMGRGFKGQNMCTLIQFMSAHLETSINIDAGH